MPGIIIMLSYHGSRHVTSSLGFILSCMRTFLGLTMNVDCNVKMCVLIELVFVSAVIRVAFVSSARTIL